MNPPEDAGVHFDRFHAEYDEALARGLSVSGEDKAFFARERILHLAGRLREAGLQPGAVLDFGCGTGDAAPLFQEILGAGEVVGVDVSERSLELARARHGSGRVHFLPLRELAGGRRFPLAFCNGVFHHVPRKERPGVVRLLRDVLEPGGLLALWDNNPWNPGARYVMWRIPFDRGAVMLSAAEARRMVEAEGLRPLRTDHRFVFPRALRALRGLEPHLAGLPLGAQYLVLARKPV